MKRLLVLFCLFVSVFLCFACDNKEDSNNNKLNISKDLSNSFKSAYALSISDYVEDVDLKKITIVDYFGTISDTHIVSMKSSYLDKYPNGVYIETIEKMEFRYDIGNRIYLIYEDVLYTPKEAYENNIIDFNNLCKIFGLHTSKLDTFNESAYNKLEVCIKANEKEPDLFELIKYYGEYNGYIAVSYSYSGVQFALAFDEQINNLKFEYGYESSRISFMNASEMLTISEALDQNIITNDNVNDLFEKHTGSEDVNENLIKQLLNPAYELCLKYKEDFKEDFTLDDFSLTKYYGKYGNSYIYSLDCNSWIDITNTSATPDEIDLMKYGFSHMAYVLNKGKLYTLDNAIKIGIVKKSLNDEIIAKYYSYN
ncbi:MAG: hypothetical protein IJA65_03355 [Acholeplasmatales bacterium]|nr:hypothetical protein [Acholeplasmatales bacterium]